MSTVFSSAPALEYRRPATSAATIAAKRTIDDALNRRERAQQSSAWAMLAAGTAALLLAPAIITTITIKLQSHVGIHTLVFAAASLVLVPMLLWVERLTRSHWFEEDEVRAGTVAPVPVAGLLELMLWGPRTIIAAMQRRRHVVHGNMLTEAACVIAYLRHFPDDGVGTDELPTIRPEPVLTYLASRDWVGLSADGRRVWLLDDARRALGFELR
jgi:hypothetical protein